MTEVETRLAGNFPALRMMMISLIVALCYEKLIESFQAAEGLWAATPEGLLLWSQFLMMSAAPLEYWFTMSLSSASLKTVFRPRNAIGPLAPALAFFVLVSNVGRWDPSIWFGGSASLFIVAWWVIRDQGREYTSDPVLTGDGDTHKNSSRAMLAIGALLLSSGVGLHTGLVGAGVAGVAMLIGLIGSIAEHVVWYYEWQGATQLDTTAGV